MSTLLAVSFSAIVLAFLAGTNQDAVGVLALSTATTIAIVRYAVPSWRNRRFVENRWLAWTGPSRTAIPADYGRLCGNKAQWQRLAHAYPDKRIRIPASDNWGPSVLKTQGIPWNPTAILAKLPPDEWTPGWNHARQPGADADDTLFNDGLSSASVSLLWGEAIGFRRCASRAIYSMPIGLLSSKPLTVDQYNGEGLTLVFGILGRNKGLRPHTLFFDSSDEWKRARGVFGSTRSSGVLASLENSSS